MEIIFLMIGISLLLALTFLLAFWWAVSTKQIDDLDTPGLRILTEGKITKSNNNKNS